MSEELGAVLEVKMIPGSVLFVDANAIDIEGFAGQEWPEEFAGDLIIPVMPTPGRTLRESIFCMDAADIPKLIEELQATLKGHACQTS